MSKSAKLLACAVAVMLLCGSVLTFAACEDNLIEKEEDIVELKTWFFTSGIPNNEITMKFPQSNATFDVCVDNGAFWVTSAQKYLQTATLNNGETVYWHYKVYSDTYPTSYAQIVAKEENNIVGYAVVQIFLDDTKSFKAEILKSVIFPKINNQYQKVTQDQVSKRIQSAKDLA